MAARARGVEVRVLIDGIGVRYTWPPVHKTLRRARRPTELFLPRVHEAGLAFFNLRNHRKVLTVDGRVAFTGGMNIQARNIHADEPARMVRDVHFRLEGRSSGSSRRRSRKTGRSRRVRCSTVRPGSLRWPSVGETTARVITDGPDGDLEVLRTVLLGALAVGARLGADRDAVLPAGSAMIAALSVAALRGVQVEIVLPERVNIPLVQWAAAAQLWQVLRPGCRVFSRRSPSITASSWWSTGKLVALRLHQLGPTQPAIELRTRRGELLHGSRGTRRGADRPTHLDRA